MGWWPFSKKEKLTLDLIFKINIELMKIFKIIDEFPRTSRGRDKKVAFLDWKPTKRELEFQMSKITINLSTINNFFYVPFSKLKQGILEEIIQNREYGEKPIKIIYEEKDTELARKIKDFLLEADHNKIIIIFETFLNLQEELKSAIKHLRSKGIIISECNQALKAINDITPLIIEFSNAFTNAMKEYLSTSHEREREEVTTAHEKKIKSLEESSGRISKRRAA